MFWTETVVLYGEGTLTIKSHQPPGLEDVSNLPLSTFWLLQTVFPEVAVCFEAAESCVVRREESCSNEIIGG